MSRPIYDSWESVPEEVIFTAIKDRMETDAFQTHTIREWLAKVTGLPIGQIPAEVDQGEWDAR